MSIVLFCNIIRITGAILVLLALIHYVAPVFASDIFLSFFAGKKKNLLTKTVGSEKQVENQTHD